MAPTLNVPPFSSGLGLAHLDSGLKFSCSSHSVTAELSGWHKQGEVLKYCNTFPPLPDAVAGNDDVRQPTVRWVRQSGAPRGARRNRREHCCSGKTHFLGKPYSPRGIYFLNQLTARHTGDAGADSNLRTPRQRLALVQWEKNVWVTC